jgi:acetyl esterase/lipase
MFPPPVWPRWALLLLLAASAASPVAASEADKLLSAETDAVLTVNVRQFLDDQRETAAVQQFLEPWRLAVRGDEAELRRYYQARNLRTVEGISVEEFLALARTFRDALGLDPFGDLDRITCGFNKVDATDCAIVTDGRFQTERVRSAIQRLAKQSLTTFKAARSGAVDVWQVGSDADGVWLALPNTRTLAITGRRQGMDDLVARATGEKQGGLSSGLRALMATTEKEHVALLMDRLDKLPPNTVTALGDVAAKILGINDNPAGKQMLDKVMSGILQDAQGVTGAALGLSFRGEGLGLHVSLRASNAETAQRLARQIDGANLLAGLAVKVQGDKLARRLGDILVGARSTVAETTVTVKADVSYAFLQDVVAETSATVYPIAARANRALLSIPIWGPQQPPPPGALEVEEVRDVAYWDDPRADPIRHRLDLFLPKEKKDYPVVVLVHGGSWSIGDNRCCGLYSAVGQFLASRGVGAALPNYRLSPWVRHPEHIKDVARAVHWTHSHIATHGGDPGRLYLIGHSAGGHLVSLLGTDEQYLRAEGMSLRDIKGVVSVSGMYRIQPGPMEVFLGGSATNSIRLDELLPLRREGGFLTLPPLGVSVSTDPFASVFGDDPKVRADASPLNHVRRGLPPFLILTAENDLPSLAGMAEVFHKALRDAGCEARLLQMEKRNHSSVMFSAYRPDDPAARAILEFLGRPSDAKRRLPCPFDP